MENLLYIKYKSLELDEHIANVRNIDMNMVITGEKNIGKFTLAKLAFPNHIIITNVSYEIIENISFASNFNGKQTIIIRDIEKLKKSQLKIIQTLSEKFWYLRFILTCKSYNQQISKHFIRYHLKYLDLHNTIHSIGIKESIPKYIINNVLTHKIQTKYHDVLLMLELARNNLPYDNIDGFQQNIIINLKESHLKIRKQLSHFILYGVDYVFILKELTKHFIKEYPNYCFEIIDSVAKYEHNMALGNKPIFHIEAFVFHIKSIVTK